MKQQAQHLVVEILREKGPLETKDILEQLEKKNILLERRELNSLLYGKLRNFVTKDVDLSGNQIWKISLQKFTATKGLEFRLYQELLDRKIITTENSQLDYSITNRKNRKVYHLDIAIFLPTSVIPAQAGIHKDRSPIVVGDDRNVRKLNIEVDGFDHLRADAMYSIQKQLREKGKNADIEIDWMDHERSFIDFKSINADAIYSWCTKHVDWCRRFHEELIWPKDISRNLYLIENGWEIMRLWNFEVREDITQCMKEIKQWIES